MCVCLSACGNNVEKLFSTRETGQLYHNLSTKQISASIVSAFQRFDCQGLLAANFLCEHCPAICAYNSICPQSICHREKKIEQQNSEPCIRKGGSALRKLLVVQNTTQRSTAIKNAMSVLDNYFALVSWLAYS
jgi:hypothetical protein